MNTIYDFTLEQLEGFVVDTLGLKKYRAKQIFSWLYKKRVVEFDTMSDVDHKTLGYFKQEFIIDPLILVKKQESKDGTIKYLFKLQDGALIETVLMSFSYGKSVCVTSQVGCNMGCKFCASGLLKKQRNLTAGEIVAQIMYVQRYLDEKEERVSNIVVMGTGEPFDNYDHVMNFCRIVNHDLGLAIGARHITISTCGIVPKIRQFAKEKTQFNLAISLHAANDALRSELMPINQGYNLKELISALKEYSTLNNRRITFEYILLKDVNDSKDDAKQLAKLISGMNAYVNLIPYNAVSEHGYQGVSDIEALRFYDALMKLNVKATLRARQGDDIDAACGQLRANYKNGEQT
ncbi:MAG: 23S rRNA (adenine(2503)-C(2))-methyltransferase RlmN [Erysipelotrichaceae bacterium]|nr:23S rRNA (adenine(2503)-C(2))-methyltransferase RlmN [Erysipelotrichaceae bacterium]